MSRFKINAEKCTGCKLCASRCYQELIAVNGKANYIDNANKCVECLQCISICPSAAISYVNNEQTNIELFNRVKNNNSILSRRSCRFYKNEPVDKDLITSIINDANLAPRFDITFTDRKFIVINSKDKLAEVRNIVLKQIEKTAKLFGILKHVFFLPKSKRENLKMIQEFFNRTVERNKTEDKMFHGAPNLVMIIGPKSNVASIDNCHYALAQLLIIAESHDLGTCINGYVSFFSKAIEKHLGIQKNHKIYAAAIIGHSQKQFSNYVRRNDSDIEWC